MANNIVIYTGAPDGHSLDWDSSELLAGFQEPIAKFAGLSRVDTTSTASGESIPSSAGMRAVWRALPLHKAHVPTGFSQQHGIQLVDPCPGSASFFTTTHVSFQTCSGSDQDVQASRELLSQFYEHSLAAHDDVPSSQLASADVTGSHETDLTTDDESSLEHSADISKESLRPPLAGRSAGYLSDLGDVPDAAYLRGVEPQTVTVNLVVGIISIAAPRTVQTRWGTSKSLVEVLVGDETKSGFAVSFWLPSSDTIAETMLAGLRSQDIVLMQNVALNVFLKKVYGHSLRKELTKVHLLYRRKLDADDVGGHYSSADMAARLTKSHPQLEKARRVREWVMKFVGQATTSTSKAPVCRPWDIPPADDDTTQ